MKINNSARCLDCDDGSLGEPISVVEQKGTQYTAYECCSCKFRWYRSHDPNADAIPPTRS